MTMFVRNDRSRRAGFRFKKTFVFAALAVNVIIWGVAAGTSPPRDHLTMEEIAAGWSMTETEPASDWSISVR
jgi:hypothetical protein